MRVKLRFLLVERYRVDGISFLLLPSTLLRTQTLVLVLTHEEGKERAINDIAALI